MNPKRHTTADQLVRFAKDPMSRTTIDEYMANYAEHITLESVHVTRVDGTWYNAGWAGEVQS